MVTKTCCRRIRGAWIAAIVVAAAPMTAGQPTISSLSPTTLAPSGRLIVTGAGFGAGGPGSSLSIDNTVAITTKWSDTEVRGYVPESVLLGTVPVTISTPAGTSNAVNLTVEPRSSDGRVSWRFQMDSNIPGRTIAVAPDGTIYATDNQRMYALSPDGGLLWVQSAAGGGLPIEIAPDGTIYTFSAGVTAVNPDGTIRWVFTPPTFSKVTHGPNLGPDGNLYVVQTSFGGSGLGIYSVDPNGNLRWSNPGNPAIFSAGGAPNTPIVFGSLAEGRFAFGHNGSNPGLTTASLFSFTFSGNQSWFSALACDGFPAQDPFGRVVTVGQGLCGITARDFTGGVLWNASPPTSIAAPSVPVVGPDGSVYTATFFSGDLWAVDANGGTLYFKSVSGFPEPIGVSPDNALLLDGGASGFGNSGFVRAFRVTDGATAWTVELPTEGLGQSVWSMNSAFSPSGDAAYVTTRFAGGGPGYSYLYAINLCGASPGTSSYGSGWPGTLGEPTLSATPPTLGSSFSLTIQSSTNAPTSGVLLVGVTPSSQPTALGGQLLVAPIVAASLSIPSAGLSLPTTLPGDPSLCGARIYVQALCADSGASKGVSFSKGLRLDLGL